MLSKLSADEHVAESFLSEDELLVISRNQWNQFKPGKPFLKQDRGERRKSSANPRQTRLKKWKTD